MKGLSEQERATAIIRHLRGRNSYGVSDYIDLCNALLKRVDFLEQTQTMPARKVFVVPEFAEQLSLFEETTP